MAAVTETFCIYHVTAPGMEPGAEELPDDFTFPTMDQLSEQVRTCCHFGQGIVLTQLADRLGTVETDLT